MQHNEKQGEKVDNEFEIGPHRVTLGAHDVTPPTPYTLLLAKKIPDLAGLTVIDIGTGSGILGILASMQGAAQVYVIDTNPVAITAAMDNAEQNGVRLVHLPCGDTIIPLPDGETLDVVISNPAQLPLPEPEADSPLLRQHYYAGSDGRGMIEEVIRAASTRLAPSGRLFMVHNSVTDFPKSMALMKTLGLEPKVIAEETMVLRPLFDRDWIDQLGGASAGLYTIKNGTPYETIYVVEAHRQ